MSLLLLSGLAKAQTTIQDQSVTHYSDGSSSRSSSATVIRDYDAERSEAREQAKEIAKEAEARVRAETEARAKMAPYFDALAAQGLVPHDRQMRAWYQDYLRDNLRKHEEIKRLSAVDQLSEGDRLPLWNVYDDEATIRIYLHDSGYTDLSDAQIAQVHAYMKANQIHHVSELGQ